MTDGAMSQDEIDALLAGVDIAASQSAGKTSGGTQLLSKEEIDDLLKAVNAAEKKEQEASGFNDRPNLFTKEHIRGISIIHEKFALMAKKSLSDHLRTQVGLSVASVDQIFMGEFNRCIPVPSALGVVNMEPLKGSVVIELDPSLACAAIKKLIGVNREPNSQWYEMAEIEKKIIISIFNCLMKCLRESWLEIIDVKPRLEKVEPDPNFIRSIPLSEWIALVTIETRVWDVQSMINICIPHTVIAPVLDKFAG